MDFRQLRYLVTVAKYGSVSRAAEALRISQSALSHYIKYAEDDLGVLLFDRSTTPLSLTYAGRCYMESARRILLEDERLMKELRDITQHMTGKLRLGTSRDRASYMMPRLIPAFAARYPGITLEVVTESSQRMKEAIRDGRVDMLLLPEPCRDRRTPQLRAEVIYSEELVLAAKAGVIPESARMGRTVRPEALDGMPFFLLFQEHAARVFCNDFFRRAHVRPKVRMEFASSITCYRMAATGLGAAIIPYMVTRLAREEEDVELFSLGEQPQTWEVQALYRKDAYLGQPERDFIQLARAAFAEEAL